MRQQTSSCSTSIVLRQQRRRWEEAWRIVAVVEPYDVPQGKGAIGQKGVCRSSHDRVSYASWAWFCGQSSLCNHQKGICMGACLCAYVCAHIWSILLVYMYVQKRRCFSLFSFKNIYLWRARELLSLKLLLQAGYSQTCGRSPEWVRICTVKAER